jgi:hypothetical protein
MQASPPHARSALLWAVSAVVKPASMIAADGVWHVSKALQVVAVAGSSLC